MANPHNTANPAARTSRSSTPLRLRALGMAVLACVLLVSVSGCATSEWFTNPTGWFNKWRFTRTEKPAEPANPIERVSLRGGETVADNAPADPAVAELEAAKKIYYDGDYAKAGPLFSKLSGDRKNSKQVVEEALYYEADCERLRGCYPAAADLYKKLLDSYPNKKHADQAREHLFNIANYWLDDTRAYMEMCREKKEGKRWWVWPLQPIHFDKTRPLFDTEGHAMRMLDTVWMMTDSNDKLGEKALFYLGSVKFFREDYRDADHYFSQLVQRYKDGKLAPEALRYSIICKQMSTGGSEYDGVLLAQALKEIHKAQVSYPELARERGDFLQRQLYSISQQQADSDFKVAEFYRRIGRPGSAYFYYELVRRRYQGTEYAKKATERMAQLKKRVDEEQAKEQAREQQASKAAQGGKPGSAPLETMPVPRTYTPGAPLAPLDNGPPPQTLPQGMLNDRRGP